MGLDTTHGCWSGPYSAFGRFREHLQDAAGWPMSEVKDEYGISWRETTRIDWSQITEENISGIWDTMPEDPLVVLIAHSDCDGIIPADACGPLADRIEELIPKLGATEKVDPEWLARAGMSEAPPRAVYDGEQEAAKRFVAGLRLAAAAGEAVEFG